MWNTYRMRAFGYWCGKNGLEVINNVRGSVYDLSYCFRGIPINSIVAIGTVGSGLKLIENRYQFNLWLSEMVKTLMPKAILIYGSSNYSSFENLKEQGIEIFQFEGKTSQDFNKRRNNYEQTKK